MLGRYPPNQMASSPTFLFILINILLNKNNTIEEKNRRVILRRIYWRVSIILARMRHQRLWVEDNCRWGNWIDIKKSLLMERQQRPIRRMHAVILHLLLPPNHFSQLHSSRHRNSPADSKLPVAEWWNSTWAAPVHLQGEEVELGYLRQDHQHPVSRHSFWQAQPIENR